MGFIKPWALQLQRLAFVVGFPMAFINWYWSHPPCFSVQQQMSGMAGDGCIAVFAHFAQD